MLFVNPFGGKKRGMQVYERHVQPLLDIAGVDAKVIITERQGHIKDTLLNANLDSINVSF